MHLTLHLADTVREIAPLTITHCVHNENLYGDLKDHVKSTHEPIIGIANNVSLDIAVDVIYHLPSMLFIYIIKYFYFNFNYFLLAMILSTTTIDFCTFLHGIETNTEVFEGIIIMILLIFIF